MKVGFVGLGIMGRPMAHNLMQGGHELFVFGKRTVPPEIREGATALRRRGTRVLSGIVAAAIIRWQPSFLE